MTLSSGPNEAIYRRDSTRFSVANDDWATLSDGVNCMEARCTDRSAEGFGICCEGNVPWSVGQTILLSRAEEACEVQIVRIVDEDGKASMGVRRVRDCVEDFQLRRIASPGASSGGDPRTIQTTRIRGRLASALSAWQVWPWQHSRSVLPCCAAAIMATGQKRPRGRTQSSRCVHPMSMRTRCIVRRRVTRRILRCAGVLFRRAVERDSIGKQRSRLDPTLRICSA